ncbi:MAG: TetR/AcrR family transcriptional regulator [Deltaproteobacteria bacterium]|nr:TetR/AcrR family transcriptional regulator [Deltaproteobacteria bacterium]MBW2399193.1 TetR/AcrR family transcriptional regulator [Deltaproteobacteria bacterium]
MTPPPRHGRKRESGDQETPLQRRVREERESVYRQAINEAAERVFADKGADGSRMNEIAAEAGISLGTLYGVIDGKESLFFGIHANRMREFMNCIRDASAAHDETLASHLAVLRLGAQYFLDRPDFLRMCCHAGFGWAHRFPASSAGAELWNEGAAIPRELFARGIAEGIFVDEDTDLLVRKMLALKQVELTHWVDHEMKAPHKEVLDRLESQFLRAFCIRDA